MMAVINLLVVIGNTKILAGHAMAGVIKRPLGEYRLFSKVVKGDIIFFFLLSHSNHSGQPLAICIHSRLKSNYVLVQMR